MMNRFLNYFILRFFVDFGNHLFYLDNFADFLEQILCDLLLNLNLLNTDLIGMIRHLYFLDHLFRGQNLDTGFNGILLYYLHQFLLFDGHFYYVCFLVEF